MKAAFALLGDLSAWRALQGGAGASATPLGGGRARSASSSTQSSIRRGGRFEGERSRRRLEQAGFAGFACDDEQLVELQTRQRLLSAIKGNDGSLKAEIAQKEKLMTSRLVEFSEALAERRYIVGEPMTAHFNRYIAWVLARAQAENVLVRFLVRDNQAQFQRAHKLIGRESRSGDAVLISLLVLLETEWVLRSRYGLSKSEIIAAFSGLLDSVELRFEDEPSIEEALFTWKDSSAEFADCLIGARHRALGCRATASFDAKAAKLPGFIAA